MYIQFWPTRCITYINVNNKHAICVTCRWDIVVMSVVLYNAWSVPMDVSFGLPADPAIEAVNVMVDVIFGADILANFRTA